jgi:pyruvate dehydrogenase (quinone)
MRPEDIAPAWERALSADKPTLLEMVTDPDVPPLPPHVSPKQARAFLSSLLHRDADSTHMVVASIREVWDSLFPPKSNKG